MLTWLKRRPSSQRPASHSLMSRLQRTIHHVNQSLFPVKAKVESILAEKVQEAGMYPRLHKLVLPLDAIVISPNVWRLTRSIRMFQVISVPLGMLIFISRSLSSRWYKATSCSLARSSSDRLWIGTGCNRTLWPNMVAHVWSPCREEREGLTEEGTSSKDHSP